METYCVRICSTGFHGGVFESPDFDEARRVFYRLCDGRSYGSLYRRFELQQLCPGLMARVLSSTLTGSDYR